ncbi:proteasome activator complex subunit 3-like [Bolinopsis microptera]|uniref:proteasome activator complex subunit 3-like n=1 Tax=Bolinopsis microptera TaxID=2820187 RepID=UPI0030791BE0
MSRTTLTSQENTAIVDKYKNEFCQEVEEILKDVFPKKIIELDKLYKSDQLKLSRAEEVKEAAKASLKDVIAQKEATSIPPAAKRKRNASSSIENGDDTKKEIRFSTKVSCNPVVTELIGFLKPEIRELIEYCNKIKMWIQLLIPKIEDGNNFGVSIQEETISEVSTFCEFAKGSFDDMSRYFVTRGKVSSKIVKYPHLEDYVKYLTELDEKQFLHIRVFTNELKMIYCCMFDIINKNLEKIKQPRSQMSSNLY